MSDSVSKLLIERYGVMVFLVVIFVLAIIAILHFGIKFDINMYIASRKERHRKLAQSYCPHLDFIPRDDNSVQVSPLFLLAARNTELVLLSMRGRFTLRTQSRGSRS